MEPAARSLLARQIALVVSLVVVGMALSSV